MYDDDEIENDGFKMNTDEDELLDIPDDKGDFGLDEEDPDKDS